MKPKPITLLNLPHTLRSLSSVHAHLIKLSVALRLPVANRLIHLYSLLGRLSSALRLFRLAPAKDAVTFNTAISALLRHNLPDHALDLLQKLFLAVRPNAFSFSIAASASPNWHCLEQVHGAGIKAGHSQSVVVGNSLVDRYRKLGSCEDAVRVFEGMESRDVVSWNSVISACRECEGAVRFFREMRVAREAPDAYTMSAVIGVCSDEGLVRVGEQAFGLVVKLGFVYNSVVLSAVIDLFSKCGRLRDAVKVFEEMPKWDSAVCNSMVAAYARDGLEEEVRRVFVEARRVGFVPTEFTFSSLLGSSSGLYVVELGMQAHSLAIKLGFSSEMMVASSLIDNYAKMSSLESATMIFNDMVFKDVVSWNTMIMALAWNGSAKKALMLFKELQRKGIQPDRITLMGVLSACSNEGMTFEGVRVFASMQSKYGVKPNVEHYIYIVDMMISLGMLEKAAEMMISLPRIPNVAPLWGVLLEACERFDNLQVAELAEEKMMELDIRCPIAYALLARMYVRRERWESVSRVKRIMNERGVAKVRGCSCIGIRGDMFAFEADQLLHCGGEKTYSMLRFLAWEMKEWGYVRSEEVGIGGD